MCGIAGVLLRRGTPEPASLDQSLARLRHRGPDAQGVYIEDAVALAHTRLSIIDLAGGDQPLIDSQGESVLIANGEIYNFIELRDELESDDRPFQTHSDSECILRVYEHFGMAGFARLHGMFAFALYSRRERRLILGRDRLGIKPLYYVCLPDRLIFASELKALFPLLPGCPELSAWGVTQYLEHGYVTGSNTLVQGIRRLEPGTVLSIDQDLRLQHTAFWSPLDVVPQNLSFGQAQEIFNPLFEQVIREHMRSDVSYGLFLSGGVDSGTLLGALTDFGQARLRTFSVGYVDGVGQDELADARRVAVRFGSEHSELRLTLEQVLGVLPLTVWAADDLIEDAACLPTALMAQQAARQLKVVFSGEGGDEVFGGYGRYRRTRLQHWLRRLQQFVQGGWQRRNISANVFRRSAYSDQVHGLLAQETPDDSLLRLARPRCWSDINQVQYFDLRTELVDDLLVKADRMLMAFGLEGRVPFLDHRLVEFGLSLPDSLKVQGRRGKVFLRRWAQRYLPAADLQRRKSGFGVPLSGLLQGPLLDQIGQRLMASAVLKDWLRPQTIHLILERQRAGGMASRQLLQLLRLVIWHRLFMEQPMRQPSANESILDWLD